MRTAPEQTCPPVITYLFGEAGPHARTVLGVAVVPFDVATEVEAIFEISCPAPIGVADSWEAYRVGRC